MSTLFQGISTFSLLVASNFFSYLLSHCDPTVQIHKREAIVYKNTISLF